MASNDAIEEELDPNLVGVLDGDDPDDDDVDNDDLVPDGFTVEGEDDEESDDPAVEALPDPGTTAVVDASVAGEAEPDEFEDDGPALIVATEREEEDVLAKRPGEFICTRCYLVKNNTQLANRSKKICRDCA